MFKKYLTWYKPSIQLITLMGLVFGCLAVYSIFSMVAIPKLSGMSIESFQNNTNYSSPSYLNTVITIQIIGSILIFLFPAILFAYFAFPSIKEYLHLSLPKKSSHWLVGTLLIICSAGLVAFTAYYNQKISFGSYFNNAEKSIGDIEKALLNFKTYDKLALTVFYIAFLPALCEEFIFRGCLQNILMQWFSKKPVWLPIVITGILFAVLHGQLQTAAPRILLGILLGYIYYYSGSIWVNVLAHFANNALAVIAAFMFNNKLIANDLNKNDMPPISTVLISLVLVVGLFYVLQKTKSAYKLAKFEYENDKDSESFLKA